MRGVDGAFQFVLLVGSLCPALAYQSTNSDLEEQARAELYAARYEKAAELYRNLLATTPSCDCYYELTRALLRTHRPKDAYAVANEALARPNQTASTQTAAGLASYRKGELTKAETHFRTALKLNANYAGALSGLAAIHSVVSYHRTARDLSRQAYAANPNDPALMQARANTLGVEEHIAALEQTLPLIDGESEDGRQLKAHIDLDKALRGRKVRRLVSDYEPTQIKMVRILGGPGRHRGFGLRVQFNQSHTVTLLLDTGASGISLSPKAAQKAGLELLSATSFEAKGIGDKKAENSSGYLASEVRVGHVRFADHPVSVFRSAKDSDIDGLIGSDVFQKFIITLDFRMSQIELQPYTTPPGEDPEDAKATLPGFHRLYRSGSHLLIPTMVNEVPSKLFLIDSGSSSNLIDAEAAQDVTRVRMDRETTVRGVQGKVDKVSRADRITLIFAGFRQENPDLVAIGLERQSDGLGMAVSGVLGMPVLGQLKLTIDYRAGAVRLER